jgi:hypothetical protein
MTVCCDTIRNYGLKKGECCRRTGGRAINRQRPALVTLTHTNASSQQFRAPHGGVGISTSLVACPARKGRRRALPSALSRAVFPTASAVQVPGVRLHRQPCKRTEELK